MKNLLLIVAVFLAGLSTVHAGVRFDASTERLSSATSLPSSELVTSCGWARRAADRNAESLVWILTNTAVNDFVALVTASNGDSLTARETGGSSPTIALLTDAQWFCWCITGNGAGASGLTGYYLIPGDTAFTSQVIGGEALTENEMAVGGPSIANYQLNGDIFNVKVWDAILTTGEMLNECKSIQPRRTVNLNRWTPLYTSVASGVIDRSGNGRNWTINGTLADSDHPPVNW